MLRRQIFAKLAGLPLLALGAARAQGAGKALKIMMKSAWGSDDPTRASFVFAHGLALADAGHEVQIFLTGEATYLMRKATADQIMPVGWPPLSEMRELEGPAAGPVGSRKQTWLPGAQSSVAQQYLSLSWSGRTELSPNKSALTLTRQRPLAEHPRFIEG